MKKFKQYILEIIGILIVLFSSPLGYLAIETLYIKQKIYLANEYFNILDGFIHSFIVVGILVFILGLYHKK